MHKSQQALKNELAQAAKAVKIDGIYSHYKKPEDTYKVLHFAITEADDTICVVYQAQYGENLVFTRPLTSWLDKVAWEGDLADRFKLT